MQSGWLRQFFHQHDAQCGHGVEADATAEVKADDDVSRRDFVKTGVVAGVAAGMAAGTIVAQTSQAQAQPANPMGRDWWPSRWGAADEKGAYNRQTPAKAMEAARLIKTGKIYPAEPGARGGDPALRRPARLAHHPRRADGRSLRDAQTLLSRRDVQRRDRPGRLAVRRPRAYRQQGRRGDPLLQRLHPGAGGGRLRPAKARHPEPRPHLHPRHPARYRQPQGHRTVSPSTTS